jgi:hypothetical protein
VKNENIKTKISLFMFLAFSIVTFFCFGKNSLAKESAPIITEAMYDPAGSNTGQSDWIELYNTTDEKIILSEKTFGLIDEEKLELGKDGTRYLNCHGIKSDMTIEPKKFILLANDVEDFSNHYPAVDKNNISDTTLDLSYSGDFLRLSNDNCQTFFAEFSYKNSWGGKDNGMTLEKIDFEKDNSENNWQESYTLGGTPGEENSKKAAEEKSTENDYTGKLKINEIFPAPKTQNAGKEFVEIVNISGEIINLSGMRIEDEKNHKVSFPEKTVAPKELFVLEGDFELNNTSSDSAYLIAKDGTKENPIDSVHYEKPKYDYAYAYDGTAWQWTSKITKSAQNQFDKLLSGKIKKDKKIYANIYANFEVSADKKAKKFTWNFGDGHKSYLKETRHKYEKSGTYNATLRITGDGKENLLNFTVRVEKFGKAKVQLTALLANPKGKDSDNEWLEIFNGTKKKVNLKNWSVATGWKNLSNHPIKKDFVLSAGETKKLTRKLCAFTLGNKQAKIELRYPDGKVADKLKYDHKNKSISEDELYQKESNNWRWVLSQNDAEEKQTNSELETKKDREIAPANIAPEIKNEEPVSTDFNLSDLGKYSENPAWRQKQENQFALLFIGSNISPTKRLLQNQSHVLGISTINLSPRKITTKKSDDQFWKKINANLNKLILMF